MESEEYQTFDSEDCGNGRPWHELTLEERIEYAEELNVEIPEHDSDKIVAMRLKPLVLKALGIMKVFLYMSMAN